MKKNIFKMTDKELFELRENAAKNTLEGFKTFARPGIVLTAGMIKPLGKNPFAGWSLAAIWIIGIICAAIACGVVIGLISWCRG